MPGGITETLKDHLAAQHFERGAGIHGVGHWKRVEANGWMLSRVTGADLIVVRCFAWFHDACRWNNGHDPQHGARGGALAAALNAEHLRLDDSRLALLVEACEGHTHRRTHSNITIATCWDSDRLDLVRLGVMIDPQYLATKEAARQEMIDEAIQRFRDSNPKARWC